MNARAHIASPFDATLDQGREAYLGSPIGKARKALSKAHKLTRALAFSLDNVSCALTRGDGSEAARTALFDAMLDLRLAVGDVEALVGLVGVERGASQSLPGGDECALASAGAEPSAAVLS